MTRRQCTGTNREGKPCAMAPIKGADVCRVHGGSAPQVKAAAARRLAAAAVEADARAVIATEGIVGVEDPMKALALLASEALAMKQALAARVNALKDVSTYSKLGVEQLKVEVQLYERAMDRAAKFLEALARSGFEERRLLFEQEQAEAVFRVIKSVLNRLDLTPEQAALSGTVVVEELRALEAEGTK